MSGTAAATSGSEARLARILDDYLAALQRGAAPDRSALLAAHPELADDLEVCLASLEFIRHAAPPSGAADRLEPEVEGDAPAAGRLGDFRILREVGRGGMGVVYEAEQISLGRRVALKVLPFAAALDPPQLARFKLEAQAAAQLHHTNIVPVYSVGVERGVHYYAMQFIDGRSLADLIGELRGPDGDASALARDLTEVRFAPPSPPAPSSRREFFRTVATLGIQAAEALEHAHRAGVLHRDVKPANLLVDASGRLWVTDFGLARLGDEANLTLSGDLPGTLRYLSPERASGSRLGYDRRTDVYSLGVTLYELLTLRPAFEGRDRADLLRRVAAEEPRPPRALDPSIPADLETIVLKAMAKEPESRYATAQEVADDLRRFLEHKPIRARRPTVLERAAKWSRRHTAAVFAIFAVLIVAVGALATSTVLIAGAQRRTQAALKMAQERSREARRAVDTMYTQVAEQWLAQKADLEPLQRRFLLEALAFYRQLIREQEASRDPAIRLETARAYGRVAELERRLGRLRDAEAAFRGALAIQDSLAASHPDPGHRLEAALTRKKVGDLLVRAGRTGEAEEVLVRSRSALEALVAEQPARDDFRRELAGVIETLGRFWKNTGRADESVAAFRRAEALYQALVDRDPADHRAQNGLADCLRGVGQEMLLQGRYSEARPALERAIRHRRAALAARPGDESSQAALADDLAVLGQVFDFMGGPPESAEANLKEAAKLHRELAQQFPNVPDYAEKAARDEGMIGSFYGEIRRYADAEEAFHRAFEGYSLLRQRSPDRVDYRLQEAIAHGNFATNLGERGRFADAEREARAAAGLYEQLLKTSPGLKPARAGLASALHSLGDALGGDFPIEGPRRPPPGPERLAEARRCLERAIELARAVLEADPEDQVGQITLRGAHHSLGHVLTLSGRYDEARRCCLDVARLYETPAGGALKAMELADDCLRIVKRASGLDAHRRDEVARSFIALGAEQRRQALSTGPQDPDGAAELALHLAYGSEPELRDLGAATTLAGSLVEGHPDSARAREALGAARYGEGRWQEAREALERAVSLGPDPSEEDEMRYLLAMTLWRVGDREGARREYRRAVSQSDLRVSRLRAEAEALIEAPDGEALGAEE